MAKKNEETHNTIDELNDQLSSVSAKVQENKKWIYWVAIAVIVVVALILGYIYAVRTPGIQKANDAIGRADLQLALGNDSTALQLYRDVADNYGYDASNRAALQAAILLYKEGKYQDAINYLDKFSGNESIIAAGAWSLKGDCYVNLDKLDDSLKCYDKAIKASDGNALYTPFFMMKEARVYAAKGDHAQEAKIYTEIRDEYPEYGNSYNIDIDRFVERANAQVGEQK